MCKVLHPYYKLAYIKHAWDGPEEQAAEIAAGNPDAKDWQDVARQIVEKTVSHFLLCGDGNSDSIVGPRWHSTLRHALALALALLDQARMGRPPVPIFLQISTNIAKLFSRPIRRKAGHQSYDVFCVPCTGM
jgi:hypothetical protein